MRDGCAIPAPTSILIGARASRLRLHRTGKCSAICEGLKCSLRAGCRKAPYARGDRGEAYCRWCVLEQGTSSAVGCGWHAPRSRSPEIHYCTVLYNTALCLTISLFQCLQLLLATEKRRRNHCVMVFGVDATSQLGLLKGIGSRVR